MLAQADLFPAEDAPRLLTRSSALGELLDDPALAADLEDLPLPELARAVVELEHWTAAQAQHGRELRGLAAGRAIGRSLEPYDGPRVDRDADPPRVSRGISGAPRGAVAPFSAEDLEEPPSPQCTLKNVLSHHPGQEPCQPATGANGCAMGGRSCRREGCEHCDPGTEAYQREALDRARRALQHQRAHVEAFEAADLRSAPLRDYYGAPAHVVATEPAPRAIREQAAALAQTADRDRALRWVRGLDTGSGVSRAWRIALCCRPQLAIQPLPGQLRVAWVLARCRDRACPSCAAARSRSLTAAAREHLAARKAELGPWRRSMLFVTMTQRKRAHEGCSAAFERLITAWHKTMRRRPFRNVFAGGLRGTEIPWLQPGTNDEVRMPGWHAHFHMALEVRPGVGRWYAETVLRSLWLEATAKADGSHVGEQEVVSLGADLVARLKLEPEGEHHITRDTRDRMLAFDCQDLDDENVGQVAKYATKPFELDDNRAPKFFRAMVNRKLCAGWGTWRRFRHSGPEPGGPQWMTSTSFRRLREAAREDSTLEVWMKRREEPSVPIGTIAPDLIGAALRGDPSWPRMLRGAVLSGRLQLGRKVWRHAAELSSADERGTKWRPVDRWGKRRQHDTWERGRSSEVYIGEIPARDVIRRLKADPRPAWQHDHDVHCRRDCSDRFRCRECDGVYGTCMLRTSYERHDVCAGCWPVWAQRMGLPVPEEAWQ